MPTPVMGVLPTSLKIPLKTCPRNKQQEGLYSPKSLRRMANHEGSTKPR